MKKPTRFILFLLLFVPLVTCYGQDSPLANIAQPGYQKKMVPNAFADPSTQPLDSKINKQGPSLKGQVVYIPPGATIKVKLDRGVGSSFSRTGEILYAHINQSSFNLPADTVAEITVLMTQPARRGFARAGKIQLVCNRLILPNGKSIWLKALVTNQAGLPKFSGQSQYGRLGNSLGKVALGVGSGAIGGLITGAAAEGNLGIGTTIGAAIGAAFGGIWAAASKGKNITLTANSSVYLLVTEGAQSYLW